MSATEAGDAGDAPVVLSATEPSGDQMGAMLIRELRGRLPGAAFAGLGGPRMRDAGLRPVTREADLAAMGYWDVLRKLPRLVRARRALLRQASRTPPRLFVGIDSPDFNLAIGRELRLRGVRTAHVVSPSVWAWRPERLLNIRRCVDLMLCLFPFEERYYADAGIPAVVIGHPDADEAPDRPDRKAALGRLGVEADGPVVAMMPGSRRQELSAHTGLFVDVAGRVSATHPDALFLVPTVGESATRFVRRHAARSRVGDRILVREGRWADCLEAADVAVVKSGTSTLQAMLRGVPMVIVYRMSWLAHRMVRTRKFRVSHFGLPNILAGEGICPELIQDDATAARIADETGRLLASSTEDLQPLRDRFLEIKGTLRLGAGTRAGEALAKLADASDPVPVRPADRSLAGHAAPGP